jgi:hypothetical protein
MAQCWTKKPLVYRKNDFEQGPILKNGFDPILKTTVLGTVFNPALKGESQLAGLEREGGLLPCIPLEPGTVCSG